MSMPMPMSPGFNGYNGLMAPHAFSPMGEKPPTTAAVNIQVFAENPAPPEFSGDMFHRTTMGPSTPISPFGMSPSTNYNPYMGMGPATLNSAAPNYAKPETSVYGRMAPVVNLKAPVFPTDSPERVQMTQDWAEAVKAQQRLANSQVTGNSALEAKAAQEAQEALKQYQALSNVVNQQALQAQRESMANQARFNALANQQQPEMPSANMNYNVGTNGSTQAQNVARPMQLSPEQRQQIATALNAKFSAPSTSTTEKLTIIRQMAASGAVNADSLALLAHNVGLPATGIPVQEQIQLQAESLVTLARLDSALHPNTPSSDLLSVRICKAILSPNKAVQSKIPNVAYLQKVVPQALQASGRGQDPAVQQLLQSAGAANAKTTSPGAVAG